MLRRFFIAALPAVLACTLGLGRAHADIYTWVDASGFVTLSNLPPPEGVRVTNVTHETPQKLATRDDAAREAVRQAELQALSDRVRQLENEVEVARRTVPPPSIAYIPVAAPAPVQYQSELAPAPSGWCDPTWASCWGLWGSGFYPASVVVVRGHNFHHFPRGHDRPGSPVQRPVRGPPAFRGR